MVEGDGVEDEVSACADRRPQLRVVGAVRDGGLDSQLGQPVGQRAGAGDRDDLPAVARERARRGAADHPRAADQDRAGH